MMPKTNYIIIGLAMLVAAGLAFALTPREKIADQGPKVDLETMIPKSFGDWALDEKIVPLRADPAVQANLDKIYNQILSRTYVNKKGERIMLSIAYGGDQSDSMQVHHPEICYPAQGFQIIKQFDTQFDTGYGAIPVRRLIATHGSRVEPITYWTAIGDKVAQGNKWKLQQLKYGLTGKIPDGLLFRVSNITNDESAAFSQHDAYIRELLIAVMPDKRTRLIGNPST